MSFCLPIIHDISPRQLCIPFAAAAGCYFLPLALDKIFSPATHFSTSIDSLRDKVRDGWKDFGKKFSWAAHFVQVQVRDNLYLSVFAVAMLSLKANSPLSPLLSHGKFVIPLLLGCTALHISRLFIVKATALFANHCLSAEVAAKVNGLANRVAPSTM